MKKKVFLLCWIIFVFYFSSAISATDRVVRSSVIFSSEIEPYQQSWQGLKEFLDEKGIALWASKYSLKVERFEEVFSKVRREKPDVVFALGTKALELTKREIGKIPVVFSMVLDPKTVTTPNITGVSLDIPARMKLREIKRIFPDVKKIGLIYSPKTDPQYKEVEQACRELDLQLIKRKIAAAEDFPPALKEISREADCLLMISDTKIYFPRQVEHLLLEGLRKKFLVVGLSSYYTKAGALISFDCDYRDLGRQAGEVILKILNGEDPADIGVRRPEKINFSLNLVTAERLGIRIPSAIIREASEVFGR